MRLITYVRVPVLGVPGAEVEEPAVDLRALEQLQKDVAALARVLAFVCLELNKKLAHNTCDDIRERWSGDT